MTRSVSNPRGGSLTTAARRALHTAPGIECSHIEDQTPTCEQDAARVVKAIEKHLLADAATERAAYAAWLADLGAMGQGAPESELRFGWDHMPQSHRHAWMKRARLILKTALDA